MKRFASIALVFLILGLMPEIVVTRMCFAWQQFDEFYSFENDMEGWSANGTDLNLDEFAITRS